MVNEFGGDYFQWLRGFYQVAQTGSVSAAARILNLRQPTVSHQIKCLEENYGVTLFDRSSGGMTLTPEGQTMLDHAITVFDSVREVSDRFVQKKTDLEGKITIASTYALIMYFLAPYITKFQEKHPEVSFEPIGGMLDVIEKGVDSGAADFGVVYLGPVRGQYDVHHLFDTSLSLITKKKNRFDIQPGISIQEIAALPFVGYQPNSTIKVVVDERFEREGCRTSNIIILNHLETMKTFVRLDLGVSIFYNYAITDRDREQLLTISLRKFFGNIPIGVITRKRKYLNPSAKAFLAELMD